MIAMKINNPIYIQDPRLPQHEHFSVYKNFWNPLLGLFLTGLTYC